MKAFSDDLFLTWNHAILVLYLPQSTVAKIKVGKLLRRTLLARCRYSLKGYIRVTTISWWFM